MTLNQDETPFGKIIEQWDKNVIDIQWKIDSNEFDVYLAPLPSVDIKLIGTIGYQLRFTSKSCRNL
jgi:prophage tail gpP-like protein